MTKNTALMTARRRAGLSQDGLAHLIQETGHRLGRPNDCNRANVARWEGGGKPQPFYVLLLEAALGQPAETLGLAYAQYDMDRDTMLAESGLDVATPLPDLSARYGYGPLSGVWLSRYEYESSSRGQTYSSQHYVQVLQRGAYLNIRSLPKQHSRLSLNLSVNGRMTKGTWAEHTSEGGYYKGAVYDGTIQLEINQTGDRMKGRWLGFGRDPGEINDGPWQFTRVDEKVDRETLEQWDKSPDGELAGKYGVSAMYARAALIMIVLIVAGLYLVPRFSTHPSTRPSAPARPVLTAFITLHFGPGLTWTCASDGANAYNCATVQPGRRQ